MEILGRHMLYRKQADNDVILNISIGENIIQVTDQDSFFIYRRFIKDQIQSESKIVSDSEPVILGIFPIPPILTPMDIAKNVYLKFKSPIIIDPKNEYVVYTKMPIEIGVYRQQMDEELLLDAFSIQKQQYALYGTPSNGVVCRYKEIDTSHSPVKGIKYEEAVVRLTIKNNIYNVIKVTKVIIPVDGVILDHINDDTVLSGDIEMILDSAFGKDVVNVRFTGARVKRMDKTSTTIREDTLVFLMDSGY